MRDSHRMKEKLDLSLDNRQIVSVLVGAIVVLGAVFVLGVVVGKKLAESGRTNDSQDILAALDDQKAVMEKVAAEKTTFQTELTKPTNDQPGQPPVRVVSLAPPKPEPEQQPEPKPEGKPAETAPVESAKPELAAAAPEPETKPEPKPAVEPAKISVISASDLKVTPASAPASKTRDQVTTATLAPSSSLSAAFERAAAPVAKGAYTLQLSAAQNRSEADKFAAAVKDRGYAPYIIEAKVPGKGTWYRVRLGHFANKDAASRYLQDFRRETQLEAFIAAAE